MDVGKLGVYATRPSTGPHKLGESLSLVILVRIRLKYVLIRSEVTNIVMQRLIKVNGKVWTDPSGFIDVVQIEKTGEDFRLIYDVRADLLFRITQEEAKFLRDPFLTSSDGKTIRYPNPVVKVNDNVQVEIATGKIMGSIKFDTGNLRCLLELLNWVKWVPWSAVNVILDNLILTDSFFKRFLQS